MHNPLLAKAIWQHLPVTDRISLASIDVIDCLESTQSWLTQQPSTLQREWRLCSAMQQHSGYGRQGRVWESALGQVAFSWRGWVAVEPEHLGLFSLNAALAVQSALIALGVAQVQLKWPNDIYIADRKLAGMLTTVVQRRGHLCDVILGIGLNRLSIALPSEAIALEGKIARLPSVAELIAAISHQWLRRLDALSSAHGRAEIRESWLSSALWLGQPIKVWQGNQSIEGIWLGITDQGALRLATHTGEQVFMADEVKLRPLD
ncbi:MAG: biotin--[acetyl-CoA-carboxylase] ligase [Gammaproteobacteria bacterium]|nr:biotin--[acetyl-CoA-carboxylase] ligase [Gammaproteobacteria bacterium]